jgi:uncharacterized protein (DUF2237 family)
MATHSTTQAPTNVLGQTLQLFSKKPLTGFHRDGYCRTSTADMGDHSVAGMHRIKALLLGLRLMNVAGIVTEEFLDYSASQGNDLRVVGLTEGCKWCRCSGRWLEALEAFKGGKISRNGVPK